MKTEDTTEKKKKKRRSRIRELTVHLLALCLLAAWTQWPQIYIKEKTTLAYVHAYNLHSNYSRNQFTLWCPQETPREDTSEWEAGPILSSEKLSPWATLMERIKCDLNG